MRTLVTLVVVATVAVAACAATTPPAPTLVPAERAAALPPMELHLLSGEPWRSADAAGRVLVIDVWATYCKPCRASFPKLNRLAARHADIAVVGVSVDEADDVVTRFLAETPATFAIARDPALTVQEPPLRIQHLPTVLLVDRQGRIRYRGDELPEAGYDALPAMVDALLAE